MGNTASSRPLAIKGQVVKQVEVLRYLGIEVEHCPSHSTLNTLLKKQRLFLLRKLRSFNVKKDISTSVYGSLIKSVLT